MGKVLKVSNVRKTINYLKKNGLKNAYYAARERIEQSKTDHYSYVPVPEDVLEKQRKELKDFDCKFSILVPAYETKEEYLHRLLQSVQAVAATLKMVLALELAADWLAFLT